MQHGGFLDQRNSSPGGVAIVAGLHATAIAALILFPPEFVHTGFTKLTTYNVPVQDPPPPIPDIPPPPQKAEQTITRPETVGPTVPNTDILALDRTVDTILPPPTGPIAPLPVEPATPEPVLATATIDARAPFQPSYPPRLARQDIEGVAVVRVLIGSDGRVKAVEQVSATDPAFYEATRAQALRHWRFKPATRDGVAVESWRTMTVRFELKA
ncbi:energy transducer TonB [Sphingomonas sp. KC8]|uniref:energy transducer TonB n=1 Tax=Sphingomonas sp. KC8 TaxID=1030157 RepID=UPI000248BE84|nr:energy transducer TonB [Sphingomonas sp. KC8]ARS28533.1 TonB family protein [Sphingomonas sp. KC8]